MWSFIAGEDFELPGSLFGSIKLARNPDPDKYKCFGYGIGFHLPLNKTLDHLNKEIIVRSIFHEGNKCNPKKPMVCESVLFAITGTFLRQVLDFRLIYVMFSATRNGDLIEKVEQYKT